jgi:DNA-binding GntR family transcriptional regulator
VNPRDNGVAQQSLADVVYEGLKREILECRLAPGQTLVENAVATRFGVSKGPVREALKRLVGQDLLRSMPRVGYVVTGIKVGDIDDIFDLRIAIEPQAVRRAMERMSPANLDQLEVLAAGEPAARKAPDDERGPALVRANRAFHVEIARLSGNARLERIVSDLVDQLERVIRVLALDLDDVPDEHPALVALMREGNPDDAVQSMLDELTANHQRMRDAALDLSSRRVRAVELF